MKKLCLLFLLPITLYSATGPVQPGLKIWQYPRTNILGIPDNFIVSHTNADGTGTNFSIPFPDLASNILGNVTNSFVEGCPADMAGKTYWPDRSETLFFAESINKVIIASNTSLPKMVLVDFSTNNPPSETAVFTFPFPSASGRLLGGIQDPDTKKLFIGYCTNISVGKMMVAWLDPNTGFLSAVNLNDLGNGFLNNFSFAKSTGGNKYVAFLAPSFSFGGSQHQLSLVDMSTESIVVTRNWLFGVNLTNGFQGSQYICYSAVNHEFAFIYYDNLVSPREYKLVRVNADTLVDVATILLSATSGVGFQNLAYDSYNNRIISQMTSNSQSYIVGLNPTTGAIECQILTESVDGIMGNGVFDPSRTNYIVSLTTPRKVKYYNMVTCQEQCSVDIFEMESPDTITYSPINGAVYVMDRAAAKDIIYELKYSLVSTFGDNFRVAQGTNTVITTNYDAGKTIYTIHGTATGGAGFGNFNPDQFIGSSSGVTNIKSGYATTNASILNITNRGSTVNTPSVASGTTTIVNDGSKTLITNILTASTTVLVSNLNDGQTIIWYLFSSEGGWGLTMPQVTSSNSNTRGFVPAMFTNTWTSFTATRSGLITNFVFNIQEYDLAPAANIIFSTNDATLVVSIQSSNTMFINFTPFTNNSSAAALENLGSNSIPAFTLTNTGDYIVGEWEGTLLNNTPNTNRFLIGFGSQTILDTGLQPASNTTWRAWTKIYNSGGSGFTNQLAVAHFEWGPSDVPFAFTNVNVVLNQTNGIVTPLFLQGAARVTGAHTNNMTSVTLFSRLR